MRYALPSALVFALALIPTAGSAQSNSSSTDSQTLQALLQEVRQLRQDVRTVTIASERSQILLSRVQAQQTAVQSAQQEYDSARERVTQEEQRSSDVQIQIKYYSDQDSEDRAPNASDRQKIEDSIARLKSRLDAYSLQEQEAQTSEMQAKERLQTEQAKLSALQEELDQIDKILQNLASQPVN
jgi:chromosome segregation ATPase